MSRKNIIYVLLILISLFLFFGTYQQRLVKASFLSNTLYYPFLNSLSRIQKLFNVLEKNQALTEKLADQTLKCYQFEQQLAEIQGEKISGIEQMEYRPAAIVGFRGNFEERLFIIDKGSLDGIRENYPVITTEGVVGKIITAALNFSLVLPYNHSSFKLGIKLKRNNLQGIMQSDINGRTSMTLIPLGSNIKIGDEVVTSNMSTLFPEGFKVGRITRISEAPDKIHMIADLTGEVDIASLDDVFVLIYEKDKSYEQEIPG